MPLPAALLARLQKRGILKHAEPEIEEEVIAEDYDDEKITEDVTQTTDQIDKLLREPWMGCPNKWNIYHDCTIFCKEIWQSGKDHSSPKTQRKRLAMLKKYPLPNGWEEVYDPGCARHYYWNTVTDDVAWLPPSHPRCKIGPTADKLRALIKDTFLEPMDEGEDQEDQTESEEENSDDEDAEREKQEERRRIRDQIREKTRARGRPKVRENDLDPMDPASYSEAPRGTWSSGLDRKGEAKTGVDTTASGPLFQMRPYPSPGAVLRLNAEIKKKDSDEEDD